MQESEASCTDGVTRGSYEGTISEDFQTIEAAWTTTGTSRKGDLYLTTGELKKLPWHNGGVVSNRFNDPSSPFRDYDKKIIKAVQKRWYSLIKKYSVYSHPGWVTVQFQITKEGKLEHVKILETSPEMKDDTFPKLFCEKAILEAGPFEPLPLNLRALAGEKPRDATFTFYY
jgi:hypothetical protein